MLQGMCDMPVWMLPPPPSEARPARAHLTLSLSECRSSSLISFNLASRMPCLVTERMASWGHQGQDAGDALAPAPLPAPARGLLTLQR